MVDFINEVQEEIRKEDYNKFLRRYGPYFAGLILAIIFATAYLEWRKSADDRVARAVSATYLAANETAQVDPERGIAEFKAIADRAPSGYAGLSLMRAAALELERGNRDAAVRLYDRAGSTFEAPRHNDLARLKSAFILAADGRTADARARLQPLAEKDAPYEFLARELLGMIALSDGDLRTARSQFSYLSTIPGVPETIAGRARDTLSVLPRNGGETATTDMGSDSEPAAPAPEAGQEDAEPVGEPDDTE